MATSTSGMIALAAYLAFRVWVLAVLAIIITFPITRLVATVTHDRRTRHAGKAAMVADAT